MANAERQPGYYWVRPLGDDLWDMGFWSGEAWMLVRRVRWLTDSDMAEIDERRLERG